mgnify:CR=1 FL=1
MEQKKKTEITKKKILMAAETEFAALGLAAARIDSIAKSAGINKQMIYAHFKSKDGLYSAVLEKVYSRLSEYQKAISDHEFEGIETIRNVITEYFSFLNNNPTFVRLMLWENLNNAEYVGDMKTTLYSGIEELLKKGIKKGIIRKDLDIEQTIISFNMFCFSAFSNVYTISKLMGKDLSSGEELEKRAKHITEVLLKYIFE